MTRLFQKQGLPGRLPASRQGRQGVTLIETVLYTGLLAFLAILVVRSSLSMHETYVYVKTLTDINNAATISLERLSRTIRDAESINVNQSVLNTNPGILRLNVPDDDGETYEVSFSRDVADRLIIQEEGGSPLPITPDHLEISNLIFRKITTNHSEGVKIELSVSNTIKGETISRDYFTSVILRGSY